MRHFLSLSRLKATDPLAQLFNAYFKGLSTLASCSEPMYVTMSEVKKGFTKGAKKKRLKSEAERFYSLTVLANSLDSIHDNVLRAIEMMQAFFTEHKGDLLRYAIENRLKNIDEYGSDEDTDWHQDGLNAKGEPNWVVTYKDDVESLSHYTLWTELSSFFGINGGRGEYLGTSTYEDFYPYTSMVEQASSFSLRKLLGSFTGQEPQIVRMQPDGSSEPMTLADHIESEMNEDIANTELVRRFNATLHTLSTLAELFQRPAIQQCEDSDFYKHVSDCLIEVRDQSFF